MKKTQLFFGLVSIIVMMVYTMSCKKDKAQDETTHVTIKLTDKPISGLKEVNIDIKEVQYHISGGNQNSGWQTITTISGIYNILELVNGFDTIIAQADIPTGKISQIRLILGNNNSLKDSLGNTHPLTIPSGSELGLKIQVHEALNSDLEYTFLLDFDAGKSIVLTGSNTYHLKPVIRLISTNSTGSIKGVVTPASSNPLVVAILGADSFSTSVDSFGNYLIKGLAAGTYKLNFYPVSPFPDSSLTGINVSVGVVTVVDTLKY